MAEDSAARTENRPRLGRGLAALLGGANPQHAEVSRAARQTPIEFLRPNPRNPRKRFDDAELDELTQLYVSRGLSPGLARQVAVELTAHDALAAHAEAEYGITPVSQPDPLRDALGVSAAFAAGGLIPWLAMVLIPGTPRAGVTFVIVLLALALTGWVSARMSDLRSARPVLRMAGIGVLAMAITYIAGLVIHP